MSLQPILILPDNRLRLISDPVAGVDDGVRTLMDDMLETMYAAPGIGLAAVQVGEPKQIIVMDLGDREGAAEGDDEDATRGRRNPRYFINPEIVWASEDLASYEEGCLSFPQIRGDVKRAIAITVKFQDERGVPHVLRCDDLLARCIMHEADHLNGVLFIDHMTKKTYAKIDEAVKTLAAETKAAAKA